MATFGDFCTKNFETNLNLRYQQIKNQKNKGTVVISTFKMDLTNAFIFSEVLLVGT